MGRLTPNINSPYLIVKRKRKRKLYVTFSHTNTVPQRRLPPPDAQSVIDPLGF